MFIRLATEQYLSDTCTWIIRLIDQVIECDVDRSEQAPNRRTVFAGGRDPRRQQRVVFADKHTVLDALLAVIHFWRQNRGPSFFNRFDALSGVLLRRFTLGQLAKLISRMDKWPSLTCKIGVRFNALWGLCGLIKPHLHWHLGRFVLRQASSLH